MQIYKSESNTVNGVVANGYMPQLSTTIKSLAISATGTEVFDLGENWQNIDNIVVSVVNGVDSATSAVTCNFANDYSLLSGTGAFQANTMCGVGVGQTVRFSSASGLSTVSANIRVSARYLRVRLANGAVSAQAATTYIDIRGYTLTP